MRDREPSCKFGSRFVLDVETLGIGFWYSSPEILKSVNFVDDPKNVENPDSKEFRRSSLIVQNILHGPFNAMINVLQPKTEKKILKLGNDLAFGRQKFCGQDEHLNASGTYSAMGINHGYNDEFFKKILSEDEYHRSTRMGITGISAIIPGYGRDEFAEEWVAELARMIAEAENVM
jgi:hypothetical protein